MLSHLVTELIQDRKSRIALLTDETNALKTVALKAKRYKVLWPDCIPIKNVNKVGRYLDIILAFSKHKDANLHKYKTLPELHSIKLEVGQVWARAAKTSAEIQSKVPPEFRTWMNQLKKAGVLKFDQTTKRWSLTETGVLMLGEELIVGGGYWYQQQL